jgi:hypothetical protein
MKKLSSAEFVAAVEAAKAAAKKILPKRVLNMNPARGEHESFAAYKKRRKAVNAYKKKLLRGKVIYVSLKGGNPYVKAEFGPIGADRDAV